MHTTLARIMRHGHGMIVGGEVKGDNGMAMAKWCAGVCNMIFLAGQSSWVYRKSSMERTSCIEVSQERLGTLESHHARPRQGSSVRPPSRSQADAIKYLYPGVCIRNMTPLSRCALRSAFVFIRHSVLMRKLMYKLVGLCPRAKATHLVVVVE